MTCLRIPHLLPVILRLQVIGCPRSVLALEICDARQAGSPKARGADVSLDGGLFSLHSFHPLQCMMFGLYTGCMSVHGDFWIVGVCSIFQLCTSMCMRAHLSIGVLFWGLTGAGLVSERSARN